jgi:hypothetical protein
MLSSNGAGAIECSIPLILNIIKYIAPFLRLVNISVQFYGHVKICNFAAIGPFNGQGPFF